jgi:hypothetical protein
VNEGDAGGYEVRVNVQCVLLDGNQSEIDQGDELVAVAGISGQSGGP